MDNTHLYQGIIDELNAGGLAIPSNAEVVMRVKRALGDPDCTIDHASKLIQAEPLLAARAVAVANSIAYNRSGVEISDLHMAVSRLGFRMLRSLTMVVLVRQVFGHPGEPQRAALQQQLWRHSMHVAAIASLIARRTGGEPETALFAGILHEIASFFIINNCEDIALLQDGGFGDWRQVGEPMITAALMQYLEAPAVVVEAVAAMHNDAPASPPQTLGDILHFADRLSPATSPLNDPQVDIGPFGAEYAATLSDEYLAGLLDESAEEVNSLVSSLA